MIPDYDFTIANNINIAVAIYKNNLKKFLKLSLVAHLWLLIPVYGWARYFAIAAWISKLSFQELDSRFDDVELKYFFRLKALLVFLFTGITATIIPALLSLVIISCIVLLYSLLERFIPLAILRPISAYLNLIDDYTLQIMFGFLILISTPIIFTYFYTVFFVSDLVFVNNAKKSPINLLGNSYKLTKKRIWKTFRTATQSIAIVFPVWSLAYILVSFIAGIILVAISYDRIENVEEDLSIILSLMLAIFYSSNILTMPLWQSVKAIVYYDLIEKNNWDIEANRKR